MERRSEANGGKGRKLKQDEYAGKDKNLNMNEIIKSLKDT